MPVSVGSLRSSASMSCLACDLTNGRAAQPRGLFHSGARWLVQHCIGPLGLGTMIVKPVRYVVSMADLTDDEATELGPLLRCPFRAGRGVPVVARILSPGAQPSARTTVDHCVHALRSGARLDLPSPR